MFDKSGLHGVEIIGRAEPFDRGDFITLMLDREAKAGIDAFAIDDNGASSALAVVTPLFCPVEFQMLAQRVEQRGARIECQLYLLAIDFK